ncbi:MAG: efflux RND transporter periplasmic adaptor subunit, partial [Calditrichaceae bacterium]|nr:efflux RND transporter periplasmic adaptor subunit [Calditrichaceae bacterium]
DPVEKNPNITDEKSDKKQEVVFIVKENRAIAKPVELSISDDTHYAILSGIEEGDEVITGPFEGLNKTLNDGDLVEVKNIKKGQNYVNTN